MRLNGDRLLDLVSVDPTGVHIQIGTAPGRFGTPVTLAGVKGGVDLAVGDSSAAVRAAATSPTRCS